MADRRAANRLSAQSSRDAKRQRLGEEEYKRQAAEAERVRLSVRLSRMVKQGCSPFPCPPLVDSSPPRGGTRWMGKSGGPWDTSGASGGPR